MQLRYYLAILRRFWLPVVLLPLLVGIISLSVAVRQPAQYRAIARALVTQAVLQPPEGTFPDFNLNYSWLSSEFVLDDIPQLVKSQAFAEDVSAVAAAQGYTVEPALVSRALNAETVHRTITFSATTAEPEAAVAIVRGAVAALQANGLSYWNRATPEDNGLNVAVLDMPERAELQESTRQLVFTVGLRVGLALVAGVGLAFLLHYLDDTLRNARQVEEWVDLQVVGVIPRE